MTYPAFPSEGILHPYEDDLMVFEVSFNRAGRRIHARHVEHHETGFRVWLCGRKRSGQEKYVKWGREGTDAMFDRTTLFVSVVTLQLYPDRSRKEWRCWMYFPKIEWK